MKLSKLHLSMLLGLCCSFTAINAVEVEKTLLKDDIQDEYVVKKGDTLWDISGNIFKSPYSWNKLWEKNPQIVNPNLIYPDDIITIKQLQNGNVEIKIN